MRLHPAILVVVISLPIEPAPATFDPTLTGSPASMTLQYSVAMQNRLAFAYVPADVARLVEAGRLVPVPGNGDYGLKGVDLPFAHPVVRTLVERLARDQRRFCGEPLVVTSLVRPVTMQPPNAHPLSVHPAGIAVDLSIPDRPECRIHLTSALLALEQRGVVDATEERSPPHLHVAVFPRAYTLYLVRLARDSARAAGARPGSEEGTPQTRSRSALLITGILAVVAAAALGALHIRTRRRGRKGG